MNIKIQWYYKDIKKKCTWRHNDIIKILRKNVHEDTMIL